jgi:hypothetical protein
LATQAFLASLRALGSQDVLVVGLLPADLVRAFAADVADNLEVVITGERRHHYLGQHPEMLSLEHLLHDTLLNPDEVHRNRTDAGVGVFYRQIGPGRYVRAVVRVQARGGRRKQSLMSYRMARARELQEGRPRLVWEKK